MDKIISLQNINIPVPRNENIIIDDLTIRLGDVIQIKAPSGRGKSFFYQTLLGMTEASNTLFRDDLHLSSLFCYCPAYLPFYTETVEEELDRIYANEGEIDQIIKSGLINSQFLKLRCKELSSGQNQMLILMRGILSKKPILIFDELTNAMDFDLKSKLVQFIHHKLLADRGIIFSLHEKSIFNVTKTIEL